jgi:hypothetical protein
MILLGVVAVLATGFVGASRWLRSVGDSKLLGNTTSENTIATHDFGLTGPGLDAEHRTKLTLVVAWREGCLGDDYARFLRDVGEAHRGDLTIVGAGLAVPAKHDPRALGRPPEAPPDPFPPRGCAPSFDVLPTSRGYVSDFLPAPATYLYDADGALIAAWRGGMSPLQRESLLTWLDGKTLDH